MLGLTLQRGLLICFTFIIIGLPFWLHIESLLVLCGAAAPIPVLSKSSCPHAICGSWHSVRYQPAGHNSLQVRTRKLQRVQRGI